jgi:hypothetical protein
MICFCGCSILPNLSEAGRKDDWTSGPGAGNDGQASGIVIVGPLLGSNAEHGFGDLGPQRSTLVTGAA